MDFPLALLLVMGAHVLGTPESGRRKLLLATHGLASMTHLPCSAFAVE